MNTSNESVHANERHLRDGGAESSASDLLRDEAGQGFAALRMALAIHREELGLALLDASLRVAVLLGLALIGAGLSIAAVWLTVAALRRGLSAWTSGAWWSDLLLGCALLLCVTITARLVRRRAHRRALHRARLRLDRAHAPESRA